MNNDERDPSVWRKMFGARNLEAEFTPPHCDPSILHAPGKCNVCDLYPNWQKLREVQLVNFTNEYDTNKAPCPSVYFRAVDVRDAWPNNREITPGDI